MALEFQSYLFLKMFDQIKDNVLIDDFKKNTVEWKAAGGRPILYKSTPQVISDLKRIGYK